jgi:hypothetical protein
MPRNSQSFSQNQNIEFQISLLNMATLGAAELQAKELEKLLVSSEPSSQNR